MAGVTMPPKLPAPDFGTAEQASRPAAAPAASRVRFMAAIRTACEPDWSRSRRSGHFLQNAAGPIRTPSSLEYGVMSRPEIRQRQPEPAPSPDLAALLTQVARGDHRAFELAYTELAGAVY